MATITNEPTSFDSADRTNDFDIVKPIALLGSLKLTVALFALSLVIVLVGTLAQDEMNMLEVKQRYFTSWIAQLHIDDLFPKAFFPHDVDKPYTLLGIPSIPFPGGALIGFLLMVNLVAAKSTRFRLQASGGRLAAGTLFMLLGFAVTGLVISSGHSSEGLQGTPPISYDMLWRCLLGGTGACALGMLFYGASATHKLARLGAIALAVLAGVFVIYASITGFRIGDPGLRIVWQLVKGLGAGVIMLVGCHYLFGKQGGNVLLHLGVAMLMFGQFIFGDRQLEQRLSLVEGEATNTLVNLDKVELTFIQEQDGIQKVTGVPASRLLAVAATDEVISDPAIPFDVRVVEYQENSRILPNEGESDVATEGLGKEYFAKELRKHGGTDEEMNVPSAYIELLDKESQESKGVFLVSQRMSDANMLFPGQDEPDMFNTVQAGEQEYKLGLRFHREVKPYWVQLEDVRRINYSGTDTPRDYSSFIRIVDPETGEDRRERVWMNNPLRFRGESFFQSSYSPLPGGKEMTGIQVVRNSGWLIPYVACSVTALGMMWHFMGTLTRFVSRRERELRKEERPARSWRGPVIAQALTLLVAVYVLVPWSLTNGESKRNKSFDLYALGQLPTQFGGRVMPLDAFARQTLKSISNRESLYLKIVEDAYEEKDEPEPKDDEEVVDELTPIRDRVGGKKISAIQWLMEVAIGEPAVRDLPMIRIDADVVRSELDLNRRSSKLYSLREVIDENDEWDRVDQMGDSIRERDTASWTFKERKIIELQNRIRQFRVTEFSMQLPSPPNIPKSFFPEGTSEVQMQMFALQSLERQLDILTRMPAPRVIPPAQETITDSVDDPDWSVFSPAFFSDAKSKMRAGGESDSPVGVDEFATILQTYGKEDTIAFNEAVDGFLAAVGSYDVPGYNAKTVGLERWMRSNSPTNNAWIIYIIALVLGLVYMLFANEDLRGGVWNVLLTAFVIHTIAIGCRIAITGRAPVINIYSSAVFIGWAAVLAGLVIERIFSKGMGNLLAAAGGVLTLSVAYGLNTGDTMPVLQAVLDTQFWLATHVICVSLGYVATFVAGTLGAGYLLANWAGKDATFQRNLYRQCYGTACFGILFSFVGTVLGGLWADDSWGRFWGWDPKENGALLIVIWNALILHARWDGMVGARGFSILAIGGNIVTAWSWFGTNELGIGLHSYGFTQGVLMWLTIFVVSQIALMTAGLCYWRKPPDHGAV